MSVPIAQRMSRDVAYTHVDHPLAEAALRMSEAGIGFLIALDGDEAVGAVTDRDIAVRGIAQGLDPSATVIAVMTRHLVRCRDTASLEDAMTIMAEQRIRRLVVVDTDDVIVGVLSLGDIARMDDPPSIALGRLLNAVWMPTATAKRAAREDPTGGRARRAEPGVPHVYASRPRIRRRQ